MAEVVWEVVAAVALGLAVVSWRAGPAARLRGAGSRAARARGQRLAVSRERLIGSAAAAGSALLLVAGLGWWGVPVAAAIGAASYVALGHLLSGEATRRRDRIVADLPQACDLLAVCLESGMPLRGAVEVIAESLGGPLGGLLEEVAAKVRLGVDEAEAWAELAGAEPALAVLGREVARTLGSGMGLSGTLRALGSDARSDAASAAEVRARRVGVRSVLPLMVCFLPAFMLLGVVPIIGGVAGHLLQP